MAAASFAGLALLFCSCTTATPRPELKGAWRAEVYDLADGSQHPVSGQIIFTDSDWTVLYFVTQDGQAQRASGEGGSYQLESAGRLVFHHLFNLSFGKDLPGLPASPLRMQIQGDAGIAEPCRYELSQDQLRLFFPSGNTMSFRRSSR